MVSSKATLTYRVDAHESGALLSKEDREALVRPYLPEPPAPSSSPRRKTPIRSFVKSQFHLLLFNILHLLFSIYIRTRRLYHSISGRISAVLYHHHRTPELIRKDIRRLSKLPKHLSIVLELSSAGGSSGGRQRRPGRGARARDRDRDGLEQLLDEVAEVCAWCACAGIPLLSVYERTGILKQYVPATHRAAADRLHAYFGPRRPSLQVRAPHMQTFLNGDVSSEDGAAAAAAASGDGEDPGHLSLLLLSAEDGRSTMVDLTRTLAEMAQQRKLGARDVTWELIDSELRDSVMAEPDLLVLFGDHVTLDAYPPWPLRLTEIFHRPDNHGVEYTVWLQGLHRFAKAQMRFGR